MYRFDSGKFIDLNFIQEKRNNAQFFFPARGHFKIKKNIRCTLECILLINPTNALIGKFEKKILVIIFNKILKI
jgi:hypothetical protein